MTEDLPPSHPGQRLQRHDPQHLVPEATSRRTGLRIMGPMFAAAGLGHVQVRQRGSAILTDCQYARQALVNTCPGCYGEHRS